MATKQEEPLGQCRVLLIGGPRMLLDIVQGILEREPDITVMRQIVRGLTPDDMHTADVDLIVMSDAGQGFSKNWDLTHDPPNKVLAVATNGRRSRLYEFRSEETELGEIEPERLAEVVRETCDPSCPPS